MQQPHDFKPTAPWSHLELRDQLLRRLRAFFHKQGFWEVETPLLSADTVVDRHLDPLRTTLYSDPRTPEKGPSFWLQTSPEFGMKRLLAAYAKPIYQVTRAFRAGEVGALHNPEFTIVEWYRPAHNMHDAIGFLSRLIDGLLDGLLGGLLDGLLDGGPAISVSYQTVFERNTGLNPLTCSQEDLRRKAQEMELAVAGNAERAESWDRDSWLDLLMSHCVQPSLGVKRPEIVYDYPASQAALARIRPTEPLVAERFELFIRGVELANGYCELQDANELRRRNQKANAQRVSDGKPPLPEESRLLEAMEHGLPACSGVALGFDRLMMLAAGVDSIDQVITFPLDRA